MCPTYIGILDIQSWWEVPCIAHFCSVLSKLFNLPEFDIEELEEGLLTDGTEDTIESINCNKRLLPELIVRLLQGCDSLRHEWKSITTSNYQMFLRRLFRLKCRKNNLKNLFNTDTDFQSLPLRTKLLILHSLCDFRLESQNVIDVLHRLKADSLRVKPLGYDEKKSTYWYFYGTRLYREDLVTTSQKKETENSVLTSYNTINNNNNSIWQVICFTKEDWENLTLKFKNTKNLKERALYNTLTNDFLPTIPKLFKEKEARQRRRLLQTRSSSRIKQQLKASGSKTPSGDYDNNLIEVEALFNEKKILKNNFNLVNNENNFNNKYDEQTIEEKIDLRKKSTDAREKRALRRSRSSSFTSIVSVYGSTTTTTAATHSTISPGSINNFDKSKIIFAPETKKENIIKMPPITNTKLPGRQTNNSLSSLTGNILISASTTTANSTNEPPPPPPPQSQQHHHQQAQASRKKKVKSSEIFSPIVIPTLSFTETEEVLQIGMHKVLEYVKNHKDAWPFMDPVEEDIAPRYYSIIRRPMDLLKMEEKLDNAEYLTFSEFRNDFKLIVNNCRLYNGQNNGNEYTEMVNNLQEAFQKSTKKYFEQHSSDEEINLEYPDIKTNVFREKQLKTKSLLPKPILTKQIDNDKNKLNKEKKSSIVNNVNNSSNNASHNNSNKKNISKSKLQASSSTKNVPSSKPAYKGADSDEADEESIIDEDDDDDYVSDKKLPLTKTVSPPILKGIKRKKKEKEKDNETVTSSKKKKLKTNKNENIDAKDEKIISKVVRSEKNDSDLDEIDDLFDEKKNLSNDKKFKAKRGKKSNKKEVVEKIEKSAKMSKKGKQKKEEIPKEDIKKKLVKESKKNSVFEKVAIVSPTKNNVSVAKQAISTTPSSKKDKSSNKAKVVQSTSKKEISKKRKHEEVDDDENKNNDMEDNIDVAMNEIDNIVAKKKQNDGKEVTSDIDDITANLNDFSSDGSLYDFPIKDKKILKQKKYKKLKKTKLNNTNNNKSKLNKKLLKSNLNSNNNDKKILDKKLYKKKYDNNTDDIINDDNNDVIDNNNKVLNQSASIHNNNNTKINNNKLIKTKVNDKNNKKKCLNNKSNLIINNNNNVNDNEDDLLSISSCNFSNSNSPIPTTTNYTSDNDTNNSLIGENDDLETSLISNNNNNNDKKTNINHKTKKTSSIISSDTNEIKDKFDLIKERRNRTIDLENNKKGKKSKHNAKQELAKDNKLTTITTVAQSTTTTPTGSSTVSAAGASAATTTKITNKNLKLNETIEKLKMKNKKSKEGSVLIDEIFGVKPSNKYHDEKTVFNKLREQCVDTTKNTHSNNNKKVNNCEYDFVDNDNNDNKNSSNNNSSLNKKVNNNKKLVNSNNSKSVKNNKPPMPLTKNKINNKTNIEALELETQQTLKDINKWLEHTPRYSQFSSTSNSPTRYYDDIDNIPTTKLDTNDFSKCLTTSSTVASNKGKLPVPSGQSNDEKNKEMKQIITSTTSPTVTTTTATQSSSLSANNTVQTTSAPVTTAATTTTVTTSSQAVASSTITSTQKKEPKERKKSKLNKEKLAAIIPNRKREPQRTIDRLQPGKTKGNLINSIQNINKPDDLHPLGSTINKIKEIKNSLLVKTDETGPKLSLGTVLNTEGFGIIQQHNFTDEEDVKDETLETSDIVKSDADESIKEEIKEKDDITKVEEEKTKVEAKKVPEKSSAAPDLSAWYGAFGGPKSAQKHKIKEPDDKIAIPDSTTTDIVSSTTSNIDTKINESCSPPPTPTPIMPKSPQSSTNLESTVLYPIPRPRKASTGSTVSEQSSFSQDPDSPRIGIDERLGAFPASYPSPLGASPILVSPKADEIVKTTPPYALNGAIKVGFYQDTTSKSSPEKSCSPKEPLPSPYPQYSSHVYSSATSATNAYTNYSTFNTPDTQQQAQQQNKNVQFGKSSADVLPSAQPYYENYKQPNSQEPEYNTATMSPNTNPNSPYQHQQSSPYHQQQNSPYQSNQATQPVAFTQQQQTLQTSQQTQVQPTQSQQTTVKTLPVVEKIPQGPNSPYQQPNSPYQQQNSPYQKSESSYQQQQQTSPFHEQQQQEAVQVPIVNPQHQSPNPPFSPSNHSSPYSQHDPNSPYSQQGPISPYQPNKMSPKQTQQQQPNVQNTVPQNAQHDWPNQQLQQQETAAELHYRKVQQQTRMDQQHVINPLMTPAQQLHNMLPNLMPAHLSSGNKQTVSPQLPYDSGMYPQSLTNCAIPSSMYDATKKADEQQKQHQQQNLQTSHLARTQNLYAPPNDNNDGTRILDLDMISGRQQTRNLSNINNSDSSMKINDKPHQNNDMVNMNYSQPILNAANKGHADETSEVDAANYRFTQAAQKQHQQQQQQQQKMDTNYQNSNTDDKSNVDNTNSFNKQQMFDNIFNSMSVYGKPPPGFDISSSKAFEMYNRAATFVSSGFPTTVTSSASSVSTNLNKKDILNTNYGKNILQHDLNSKNNVNTQQQHQQQHLAYQMPNASSVPTNLRVNQPLVNEKQLNMPTGYNQQQSQQQSTNLNKAIPSYHNLQPINKSTMEQQLNPISSEHDKHSHINFNLQHNKHLLNQQHPSANDLVIPNPYKTGTENLGGPQSSNQHKLTDLNAANMQRFDIPSRAPAQNQQLNMDLSGYKPPTFNTPTSTPMIDPGLRNLASLSMMDRYSSNESILGFQGSTSAGYYDKSMPPAAHMFGKNLQQSNTSSGIQQMFGNPMAYNTGREDQQMPNYQSNRSAMQDSHLQAQQKSANLTGSGISQQTPVPEVVKPKKGRRKKNATPATAPVPTAAQDVTTNQHLLQQQQGQQQQQQQQQQQHQQQQQQHLQGFQSYAGLKNIATSSAPTSADLKAAGVVPGSAFNFGPTPPIGLASGIYGENTGYLDEYRNTTNSYYLSATPHRGTPDPSNNDKTANAPPASPASFHHQFLSHSNPRTTYPFMNPQLDPNSPLYQQYIQRHQEELRTQMIINQGLMSGPPGSYPQTTSYHPALGMHKPYDAMNSMNRSSWYH